MWRSDSPDEHRKAKKQFWIATISLAAVLSPFVYFSEKTEQPSVNTQVNPSSIPTPTDALEKKTTSFAPTKVHFLKQSCREVAAIFGTNSAYSSIQKQALWNSYAGKPIYWSFEIVDIQSSFLGGYTGIFRCYPSESPLYDLEMSFPAELQKEVMAFRKGQIYRIEGVLDSYGEDSGILQIEALLRDGSGRVISGTE